MENQKGDFEDHGDLPPSQDRRKFLAWMAAMGLIPKSDAEAQNSAPFTNMDRDADYSDQYFPDGAELYILRDNAQRQLGRSITFNPGKCRFELFVRSQTSNFGFNQNRITFPGTSVFQGAGPFFSPQGKIEGRTIQNGVELTGTDPAAKDATTLVVFRNGAPELHHTDDPGFNPRIDSTCDAFTQIPLIKNGSPNANYLKGKNLNFKFNDGLRFLTEVEGIDNKSRTYKSFHIVHVDGPASRQDAINVLMGMNRTGSPSRSVKNAVWLDMGVVSGGKMYGKPNAGGQLVGETIGKFSATSPEGPYRATFIAGTK